MMPGGAASYGGYHAESPESRTLRSFSADKFEYRDQAKNLIQLNNAVGFMSGMMRKMQSGIDKANQNYIQQLQSLITDFIVMLGGGGDTGLDFGDLKYVIQAIGALFGFADSEGNITVPVNLFTAAWHFFTNYIGITDNFKELINQLIDAAIATILDIFGEVPILGQALQQFAVIVSDIRDLLNPIADAVQAMFDALNIDLSDITGIGDLFGPLKPIWEAFTTALDGIVLPDFTPMFHMIAQWSQPFVQLIVNAINIATAFIKLFTGQGDATTLDDAFKAFSTLADPVGAPTGLGTVDIGSAIIQFLLNPVAGITTFLASLIPGIDASKVISGQFPQEMVTGLVEGLNQLYYNIQKSLVGLVTGESWQSLLDNLWGSMFSDGSSGHVVEDILTAMQSIPGLNIVSTILASIIPGIDASKVTSGTFTNTFIPGLVSLINTLFGSGTIGATILGIVVPGLDASKIISGLFGQSQISGLSTDLASKTSNSVFNASAQAGPNTVLGPGFEDTTIPRNNSGTTGSGYSAEQKHSGTQSFKIVSQGGWDEVDLIPVAGGTSVQDVSKSIKVMPGQKWYISVWCYAKSTNVGTNNAGLDALFSDSSGVNGLSYNLINGALTTVTVSTWTKISGYITVPAGYDRMLPYFFTDNPTTVGNIWYVDDAEVYEETVVQNALSAFNASTTAGSNLVIGPDFEDTTIPRWAYHTGSVPGGGAYSTTVARSGTHSYSLTRQVGKQETFVWLLPGIKEPGAGPTDRTTGIKVQPGQKFYMEAWYWSPVANTQAAGLLVALEVGAVDSLTGAATWVTIQQHDNTAVIEGAWTKLSGYYTVPAGKDLLFPYVHSYQSAATSTNVYYFDDVIVREDVTPANSTGVQDLINGITNYLTGLAGTGWGQTSANNALTGTKQSIEQNAAAIQAITTTSGGGAASGKSVVVNYNDYANGSLPATHTVALFGTNASTVSILNGRVHANMVGGGDYKYWEILYNATQTNTDYQLVGITLTSLMGSGFGSQATNWIKGRSNLAQTRYVYAEFRKDDFNNLYFRLVASTASGGIVWKDWTSCPWATTAWLQCGTTGGARIYKVWVGNQVVWTHNEVGTLSDVGASNRYAGHGGIVLPTGPVGPGDVSQFAFYDNMPPATVGSGAIITRTATGSTQANAGATQYISNGDTFFNNIERKTDDITIDQVWGGFSVRDAGWYKVKASVKIAGAAYPDRISLRLLGASATTPDQAKYGGRDHARMLSGGAVSTPPRWIGDEWEVYLDANEYVYLGYDCAVLNVAGVFTGEATGLQTYFSIALINKNQN